MTTLDRRPVAAAEGPRILHAPAQRSPRGAWLLSLLRTTDHKTIGRLYLVTSLGFFVVGGALAMLMRAELARPGLQLLSAEQYNQLITTHGTIMLLLFATPILFARGRATQGGTTVLVAYFGRDHHVTRIERGIQSTGHPRHDQRRGLQVHSKRRPARARTDRMPQRSTVAPGTRPFSAAYSLRSVVTTTRSPLVADLRRMGLRVHTGPVVSCERVDGARHRAQLGASGALAVDIESAAIVRAAGQSLPTAVVRILVDTVHTPALCPITVVTGSRALRRYPHPIYVRRQIVHNAHVVADLEGRGAVFVEELREVPDGTAVVFSAHGVAPAVREEANRRGLTVIDATCPLVTKVHAEARQFVSRGNTVLLIGHDGHDETEGTVDEAPDRISLVENIEQAETVAPADPSRVAMLMQTTRGVEEAAEVANVLRRRLVEVAQRCGTPAHLVDDATAILPEWLAEARTVGITAGGSAPPYLVDEVIATLRALGPVDVIEREVTHERMRFALPKEVAD